MSESNKSITYLAVGDSLTEGVGAERPDRHLVAQLFSNIRKTDHCRVQNMGISGLTSKDLYELLRTAALLKAIPRASHITITTGGCDFIDWFEQGAGLTSLIHTIRGVRSHAEKILTLVRRLNPEASMHMMGFYVPVPAYELGFAVASKALQSMNVSYTQLCRKFDVHMVNPFEAFLHRHDYFADEVHPNQLGYDALAHLFLQPLTSQEMVEVVPVDPSPEGSMC
ncbi:GDSL-type esterase/lipase family protein [Marininema halotolerans]|uniref:Lysophospholipase L1 n=1 Tax=Marininema halotolerans TaxID=1155944 RepID=A0A1I6RNL9_9BACL|nr:GDSL-type esterase/lipase family protein [Marininema halotolerans]SFS66299.1 Lysophospholipase L1 [Marininema halotolerans]